MSHPRFFHEVIETMPRPALAALQEARLLNVIARAYRNSALIREVWDEAGVAPADIRSAADFRAKAPFIDKDRIRRFREEHGDAFGGLACIPPGDAKNVGTTSGTTGDPTPVLNDVEASPEIQVKRDLWALGARPGDFMSYLSFTFRNGHGFDRFSDLGITPIAFQISPDEVPRLVEASLRFRPTVMFMLATPLVLALERFFASSPLDPRNVFRSYRGAVFGGEPLGGRLRQLLADWGLEIFEFTSLGDVAGAMECSAHDGMHTYEDLVLVETLDPFGDTPVVEGERAELVVTSLNEHVAPLIRFRTDDLVTFTSTACTCGRTHGRMKPLGRKGDEILVDGKLILPRDVWSLIEAVPATSAALFQIIRPDRQLDRLRLRVGVDPDAVAGKSRAALAAELGERVARTLGVPSEIELIDNAELLKLGPPHKIPRVARA
jgi:phenylacetate-CoA ligase